MYKPSVAFDFDGTIIDISRRDYAIYSDLIVDLSGTALPFRVYWPMRRARTDIHSILAQSGIIDKCRVEEFLQKRSCLMEAEKYLALDTLIPNVVKIIKYNRSLFAPYLVTTRQEASMLFWQIDRLNLKSLFIDIIIADKDKTKSYAKIRDLKLIIGDTENDIIAANNLGIDSVAVLSGIRDAEIISLSSPGHIAESAATVMYANIIK